MSAQAACPLDSPVLDLCFLSYQLESVALTAVLESSAIPGIQAGAMTNALREKNK